MTRSLAALAASALLLSGCVLDDGTAEVRLLPEGPIVSRDGYVLVYVETSAMGRPRVLVDGEDSGVDVETNAFVPIPLVHAAPGEHRLQARVFDGTRAAESNVVVVVLSPPP